MLLAFNFGRIGSYVLIATLVALASTTAASQWSTAGLVLRSLAGVLLIFMGLSMGQWWQGIRYVERVGAPVWARLSPLTRRFLPVNHGDRRLPSEHSGAGCPAGWFTALSDGQRYNRRWTRPH